MTQVSAERAVLRLPNCVADDWGLSPGVNEGILALCKTGIVRGVSLFGNLEHTACGLERLLKIDGLRYSVHLNLTHGPPLSRPEEIPSLCRADGLFQGLPSLLRKAFCGRLSAHELELETRRQISRLVALGVPLTGIEGHHHVHLIPHVFAALASVFREKGLAWIRIPVDWSHVPSRLAGSLFKRWRLSAAAPASARQFKLQPTLYLRDEDLRTRRSLELKLLNDDGLPVIVHPALYNDLPRMPHSDPYQNERVLLFREILKWSRGPSAASR